MRSRENSNLEPSTGKKKGRKEGREGRVGRSGGGRKGRKTCSLFHPYPQNFKLWRQLSDNMERLLPLKEDLDYLTVSKIKEHATPHRATWENTSVG